MIRHEWWSNGLRSYEIVLGIIPSKTAAGAWESNRPEEHLWEDGVPREECEQ